MPPKPGPSRRSDESIRREGDVEFEFDVPLAGRILPEDQWAKTALKKLPDEGPLDTHSLFGRSAPLILDIGCGNGRFTLASAVRRPDCDHIGIDPLPLVIRYATRRANQRGLHNVRFAVCDGVRFLETMCADGSVTEVHIYHPQPYQQHDGESKRLFTPSFLHLLHDKLVPSGSVFVQTDNIAYWKYIRSVLSQVMQWHDQPTPWPEDPQGRTRREIVAVHKGLPVFRGRATRRDDFTLEALQSILEQLPAPDFKATPKRNPKSWRRPGKRKR